MLFKSIALIAIFLVYFNGSVNLTPSVNFTNASNQLLAMTFGSPSDPSTKVARIDITMTSEFLVESSNSHPGAIWAVTDTSGALSIAEYNALLVYFQWFAPNKCNDTSSTFMWKINKGVLNSTGTSFNYISTSNPTILNGYIHTVTGTGNSEDPYVWSFGKDFNSSDVTKYSIPTSDQFISCWAIVDLRLSDTVWNNYLDLGSNTNIVFNDSFSTSVTPSSPANEKSDSLDIISFKQGLMIIACFVSLQIS